nr:GHKL domain-containing protein [Salipaludibacillus agaradhaerens]
MLVQKKYDECKKFIDDLLRKTIFSNETYPINSSAVQGLLLAFKEEAFNKGIEVDYEIRSSLSKANCNSLDLNCIIGNMLQNAIEDIELENKYPKIILLKTYEKNHRVFIKVTNYGDVKGFEEHVDKIFNKGYTTKVNKIKTNEGLGLFTVQKIIEENNSIIYPLIEGDTISFVVSFPIGGE